MAEHGSSSLKGIVFSKLTMNLTKLTINRTAKRFEKQQMEIKP
jgi:hypothetical protein